MIDVVSRRCQHPQCVRRPLYAMPGQRAMFCRTHKDPGHTDVVSRRCNFEVSAQLNTFCCWTLLNAAPTSRGLYFMAACFCVPRVCTPSRFLCVLEQRRSSM